MKPIDYFKLQAKNLFKDYKTQFVDHILPDGTTCYDYMPEYFDLTTIWLDFEEYFDEENFSLMKAQHLMAIMLGFNKWSDLLNASEVELELAKLRFDNQDRISFEEWEENVLMIEGEHNFTFDAQGKLDYFKHGLSVPGGHGLFDKDYRLSQNIRFEQINDKQPVTIRTDDDVKIISLPLSKENRVEFINTANSVFKSITAQIEPRNLELTHQLWDAENYVDNCLLTENMLPISKSYALSLIDAFMLQHAIGLAVQADKMAEQVEALKEL